MEVAVYPVPSVQCRRAALHDPLAGLDLGGACRSAPGIEPDMGLEEQILMAKKHSKWPLYLIGASASVAVWSGWVGLGGLSGFGLIHPLPGIWDSFHLNTAITLPVGVEAYGAYALGMWIDPLTPKVAKTFAKRSAIGSLLLGMLGQVAFHLLNADHRVAAPWEIVTAVSCLPVVTLGLAAALHHLRGLEDEPAQARWRTFDEIEAEDIADGRIDETQVAVHHERMHAEMTAPDIQKLMDPVIKDWATAAPEPAPWSDPNWKVPPPTQPTFTPVTETGAQQAVGSVNVRSPLGRADRKVPADERAVARMTGSFPAATE